MHTPHHHSSLQSKRPPTVASQQSTPRLQRHHHHHQSPNAKSNPHEDNKSSRHNHTPRQPPQPPLIRPNFNRSTKGLQAQLNNLNQLRTRPKHHLPQPIPTTNNRRPPHTTTNLPQHTHNAKNINMQHRTRQLRNSSNKYQYQRQPSRHPTINANKAQQR